MSIIRELYEDLSILNSIEKTVTKVQHQHLTKEQQDYLNNERARLKKKIRKHQRAADPIEKSLRDGSHRWVYNEENAHEFWCKCCAGWTDEEIDEFVSQYDRPPRCPGDWFSRAHWNRLNDSKVVVIVLHSLDI